MCFSNAMRDVFQLLIKLKESTIYLSTLQGLTFLGSRRAWASELEKSSDFQRMARMHSREMTEWVNTCRSLHHEFINHMQVIYGMVQTEKSDSVPDYIRRISQDIAIRHALDGVEPGLFAQMIHGMMNAARSMALDFSVRVRADAPWLGFQDRMDEKVLLLRILLLNVMNGLSHQPDDMRWLTMTIEIVPEMDRVEIEFPSMDGKELSTLPTDMKKMLGWDDTMNAADIWTGLLQGQYWTEKMADGKERIILVSPRNTDT